MSTRKSYKPADYEPCPAGCGHTRWKGLTLPVCDSCSDIVLPALINARNALSRDNASLTVMQAIDAAIVADCREILAQRGKPNPLRSLAKP